MVRRFAVATLAAIFLSPVVVIVRMLVPFAQQCVVVRQVPRHCAALDEALRLGRPADTVAFLIQAQAGVRFESDRNRRKKKGLTARRRKSLLDKSAGNRT